tara:strand:+ start:4310 stop:6010 length:1701 start_codon:yes stop_codon:yes gene_type:complete
MANNYHSEFPYWSIYYDDEGYDIKGNRIMGRQAAGWSFLQALIKDDPKRISAYIKNQDQKELLLNKVKPLVKKDQKLEVDFIPYNQPFKSQPYGGIFLPGPGINDFASKRSIHGHDSYSLVGITHTTASHAVMSGISNIIMSDIMPWDAIICTSNCVLDTVEKIIDHRYQRLKSKFNISKPELPLLPVIPLGLDVDEFNYSKDFKKKSRLSLDINDEDIVIAYVGRLSFHAKAHHLPMYLAIEEISKELKDNQKIHIIQTGWFANDFVKDAFVEEGLKICPSIEFHFLDGKDQDNKHKTLAAGDIFVSLSDNIQETFGLTPLEGMAAGLPVLVSDWDGYKSTARDNVDGFRAKTISLPDGYGEDIAYRYMMNDINYDLYVGLSVQKVGVDIKDCIDKLRILITDDEKRKKFGKSAKIRAKEDFNWPVILSMYRDLSTELNKIRNTVSSNYETFCLKSLPSDRLDPFLTFSSYPSIILNKKTELYKLQNINNLSFKELLKFKSVEYAQRDLPSEDNIKTIYELFPNNNKLNVEEVINSSGIEESKVFETIVWLIKFGYLTTSGESDG